MIYCLSVTVRDTRTAKVLSSRIVLKHSNRLFLESLLEVSNGFISRIIQEEKAAYTKEVLILFQVQSL